MKRTKIKSWNDSSGIYPLGEKVFYIFKQFSKSSWSDRLFMEYKSQIWHPPMCAWGGNNFFLPCLQFLTYSKQRCYSDLYNNTNLTVFFTAYKKILQDLTQCLSFDPASSLPTLLYLLISSFRLVFSPIEQPGVPKL